MSEKDELAGIIADELNKQFKHQKVAYFLDEGANPTDVTDFISTGSTILDLAIANRWYSSLHRYRISSISRIFESYWCGYY
jgi:hypothetical protein